MRLAVVLALVAGCSTGPMFSPEELQPLVSAAMQRTAANRAAKVDAWIAPLVEGTSPAGRCLAHVPWTGQGVQHDDCGHVLATELALPATGVSPYQTGVRPMPDAPATLKIAAAVEVHVERLVAAGRGAEAVQLAGDALAFATTLMNGHVPVIVMAYGCALARQVATKLAPIVDTLSAKDRAALLAHIDAALAALPRPADLIEGELEWSEMRAISDPMGTFGAPHEETGVRLFANERVRRMWSNACGGTTSIERCAAALPARPAAPRSFEAQRVLYIDAVAAPVASLREQLVSSEANVLFSWQTNAVHQLATTTTELEALRARAAR